MVELVHDYEIVIVRGSNSAKILGVEGFDGNKQMFEAVRHNSANAKFSEIRVMKHSTEATNALFEYLFPVRHKKQPRTSVLLTEAHVIECRNDGFACARCGDNKVLVVMTYLSLGG